MPSGTSDSLRKTLSVTLEVVQERERQDSLWGDMASRSTTPIQFLSILMEEVGEAAMAANDDDYANYREELIQVAAVAVAMVESYDLHGWRSPWQ